MRPAVRAVAVSGRDLAVEAAGRELTVAALPFIASAAVLAGLGFGPRPEDLRAVAPGLVWLLVLFAAVPLSRGLAAAEREDGCWDLLRAVVSPTALLTGKAAALWLQLTVAWAVAAAITALLFAAPATPLALAAGPLATLGLAVVTTLFGVLVSGSDGGEGLLAVLLLPAALPVLLAATQLATPAVAPLPWLALLAAYDAVTATVAWAVFPVLLEE